MKRIETRITRALGVDLPICSAGMAFVARPALAAAVSNAGGLGGLGCDMMPAEALRAMIRETRHLTPKPISVDLIGDFLTDGHIDVCVAERVEVVVFFWSLPVRRQVERLRQSGSQVWMQVGSVAEARAAATLGADAVIAQGSEAGGHNRSEAATMTLLPAVRRAVAPVPVIAAGGIADGRGLLAALSLGAEAVWCGTRFLASVEANAHPGYKRRVLEAGIGDTVRTRLFGREWPDQMSRVIVNRVVRDWGDRPAVAMATPADRAVGSTVIGGSRLPVPTFSAILPTPETDADLEEMGLTAGESAGNIAALLSAADIVATMAEEAMAAHAALAAAIPSPSPCAG